MPFSSSFPLNMGCPRQLDANHKSDAGPICTQTLVLSDVCFCALETLEIFQVGGMDRGILSIMKHGCVICILPLGHPPTEHGSPGTTSKNSREFIEGS